MLLIAVGLVLAIRQSKEVPPYQTYRNDRYRFTVHFPQDWLVAENNSAHITTGFAPLRQVGSYEPDYYPLFISVYDTRGWKSVKDYYQHICDDERACSASSDLFAASSEALPVTIANSQGVKFLNARGPISSTIVSFVHGGYLVEITKHDNPQATGSSLDEALNLVVSSFTFF